jgi:hypothetical protein
MVTDADAIKRKLRSPKAPEPGPDYSKGLSSGSTLLNLACSGRYNVAYLPGGYHYFVGDTHSGKSWLSMLTFAEAALNPHYARHRFVYDSTENGALMDVRKFFGPAVLDRLEPPAGGPAAPQSSTTVEDFYFNVDDALKDKRPFIYVLDSMDPLVAKAEEERFEKAKKARRGQAKEKEAGSYNTDRPKQNSALIRNVFNKLKVSESILIIISQTRQNISFGAQFNPRTHSGGDALTFYANLKFWTSVKEHLYAAYKGKKVEQGIVCKVAVKKSRMAGRARTVFVPIYHSSGLDDVGSMVDWLVEWKHWKAKGDEEDRRKVRVTAPELGLEDCPREKVVRAVEEAGKEEQLRMLVASVWNDIEEAVSVRRKPRYGQAVTQVDGGEEAAGE